MANPSDVLRRVEEVEYLKASAKNTADALLDDIDGQELLTDPDEFLDDLLAALTVAVAAYVDETVDAARIYAEGLGLAELTATEAETIKREVVRDVLSKGLNDLSSRLGSAIGRIDDMVAGGLAEETILRNLQSDAGRDALLVGFTAAFTGLAVSMIAETERRYLDTATRLTVTLTADFTEETFGEPSQEFLFTWVSVNDGNVCSDIEENSCDPRHGMSLTLEEWDELGRPGSPNLLCSIYAAARGASSYCRCSLEPSGSSTPSPEPINVADAIKAGKERASNR